MWAFIDLDSTEGVWAPKVVSGTAKLLWQRKLVVPDTSNSMENTTETTLIVLLLRLVNESSHAPTKSSRGFLRLDIPPQGSFPYVQVAGEDLDRLRLLEALDPSGTVPVFAEVTPTEQSWLFKFVRFADGPRSTDVDGPSSTWAQALRASAALELTV